MDGGADLVGIEVGFDQFEVEAQVQLVGPDVFGKAGVVVDPDLADGHHIAVLVEHLADLSVVLVYTLVVEAWVLVGDMQHRGFGVFDIGQTGRFGHAVRDVEAESVDAAVQPEAQGIGEVVEYLGVVPVDVGLFGANRCRYHWPGVPSASVTRVQAGPPKTEGQLFGGSSPCAPLPSRKM